MSVAIGTPTRPWGVLVVATVNVRNFTDDDVVFLQALSNVLGAALS
jgi:GAF domain-containing protein